MRWPCRANVKGACHVMQGGLQAGGFVREELAADEGIRSLNDLELWVRHQSNALKDTDCSDDQRCKEVTRCQRVCGQLLQFAVGCMASAAG